MSKRFLALLFLSLLLMQAYIPLSGFAFASASDGQVIVDGYSDDWQDIEPAIIDPRYDGEFSDEPSSDLRNLYITSDLRNLYIMVECYGPLTGKEMIDVGFIRIELSDNCVQFSREGISWPEDAKEKGVEVAYGVVAELAVPLSLFKLPCVEIGAGVWAWDHTTMSWQWNDGTEHGVSFMIDEGKCIRMRYHVYLDPHRQLVHISAEASNVGYFSDLRLKFKFRSHWVYPTSFCYLANLSFESNGLPLTYQVVGVDEWRILGTFEDVEISYTLNMSLHPAEGNYIDENYAFFFSGTLFIYPEVEGYYRSPVVGIEAEFHVPEEWEVIVPWFMLDRHRYSSSDLNEVTCGHIGFGKFHAAEYNINNVSLIVALPHETIVSHDQILNVTVGCFEYFMSFLNCSYPGKRFAVIFTPPPEPCSTADFGGPGVLVSSDVHHYEEDEVLIEQIRRYCELCGRKAIHLWELGFTHWWLIPHEMFHTLDGFSGGCYEEGLVQYYGYKALIYAGVWSMEDFYSYICGRFDFPTQTFISELNYYYTEIWRTEYNLPIASEELERKIEENPEEWRYGWIGAGKMVTVAYMLDKGIKQVTDGKSGLDDVISYINTRYLDPLHGVPPEELLQTVNLISGQDFTDFFNRFVFGNDWLPPVMIQDWLEYYIDEAERLLVEVKLPVKDELRKTLDTLKVEATEVIKLIYEERYEEAHSKLELTTKAFNSLLESIRFYITAKPATFKLDNLSINPLEASPGEVVSISVNIVNTGDLEGTYKVTLMVNGTIVETRRVTLASGESKTVTLPITEFKEGPYIVEVDDLSGIFKVRGYPTPTPSPLPIPTPPEYTYIIVGVIAMVIAGSIILVMRRRRKV